MLVDSFHRTLRDLRVSVTDRCNFRCLYCLPESEAAENFYRDRWKFRSGDAIRPRWKPKRDILAFEEITRFVRLAARCGIEKLRVTGGEPLLRRNLPDLIRRLAEIPGIRDLAMTTNGFVFPKYARSLRAAGLQRVSFSLDSFDPDNFRKLTGVQGLEQVTRSVKLAQQLGFFPVKVNAVVIKDINDHEIVALARYAREEGVSMRFIEFMPLDARKSWQREHVVSGRDMLSRLREAFSLTEIDSERPAETARRWRIDDSDGEIGIIAPVTEPFCGHCDRLRLTADGQVRTCLFSVQEHDFRSLMRSTGDDEVIETRLREVVSLKEPGHRIGREDFVYPSRSMSSIGG